MAENRTKSAQYLLRMPPGLRERIKAYADRHGRSLNEEIVRVLEREFPEPWTAEQRIADLLQTVSILRAGATDERINRLADELVSTVEGIYSGRLKGLDDVTRQAINFQFEKWKEVEADDYRDLAGLDPEEEVALARTGRTEKFVDPFEDEK